MISYGAEHMKTGLKFLVVSAIAALTISPRAAIAQWVPASPPTFTSGYVVSLAANAKFQLAGTSEEGVYESTDHGAAWNLIGLKGTLEYIRALVITDTSFVAATTFGVFISRDSGGTWTKVYENYNGFFTTLAVSHNCLFAAGQSQGLGVYRSTDGGVTWTPADSGLPTMDVDSLAACDSNMFAITIDGLYQSDDSGNTWTECDSNVTRGVGVIAARDSVVCAAIGGVLLSTANYGVLVSTNRGESWARVGSALSDSDVQAIAISDSDIYIGTGSGGIFRSSDNGVVWDSVNTVSPQTIGAMAASGSDLYVGTNGGGVYAFTNNGSDQVVQGTGLNTVEVGSFAAGKNKLFASSAGGLFASTDGGESWDPADSGLLNTTVYSLLSTGSSILAGTGGGIFRSTDNGVTWTLADPSYSSSAVFALTSFNNDVYAATSGKLLFSVDDGTVWGASNMFVTDMNSFAQIGNTLFVGNMIGGGVFALTVSDTGGWSNRDNNLTNLYVTSLHAVGKMLYVNTQGGEFESANGGLGWVAADTKPLGGVIEAVASDGQATFVGTTGGVYVSGDSGNTWALADSGLVNPSIKSMIDFDSTLYVGLYAGSVWKRPLSQILALLPPQPVTITPRADSTVDVDPVTLHWNAGQGAASYEVEIAFDSNFANLLRDTTSITATSAVVPGIASDKTYYWRVRSWRPQLAGEWSATSMFVTGTVTGVNGHPDLPTHFSLSQNYPNPFNPTTNIGYRIADVGLVTLKVYNVLGELVKTLVNKVEQPGSYRVQFDGSNLASGVYFYRLQAGTFTQTRKLLLLK